MSYAVISCSLNTQSRSRVLAHHAADLLREETDAVNFIDLRERGLPPCDGVSCYEHEGVVRISSEIRAAHGILIATPIYNYGASASAKNLIELTGDAWTDKVVGFLCAAGGARSYMAVMALANNLMLDFRSVVLPRFVYTDESDFTDGAIADPTIHGRLGELTKALVRFSKTFNLPH